MSCQVRRLVKLGIDKRDPDALTADEIRSISFALSHPSNHVDCLSCILILMEVPFQKVCLLGHRPEHDHLAEGFGHQRQVGLIFT